MIKGKSHRIRQIAILFLFILTIPGVLATKASGDTYTWNGSVDSDWNKPDNWTPLGIPSDNDDVIISSGTVTYSSLPAYTSGLNTIQISGGTLNVSSGTLDTGTLTISSGTVNYSTATSIGTLTFSDGTLTGAGTVTVSTSFT